MTKKNKSKKTPAKAEEKAEVKKEEKKLKKSKKVGRKKIITGDFMNTINLLSTGKNPRKVVLLQQRWKSTKQYNL